MTRPDHLRILRTAELDLLRRFFRPGVRVLEIGGGNGWQARQLRDWGCQVASIDIDPVGHWQNTYFPVLAYDGMRIPFRNGVFDVVFSSNVLEHVGRLEDLMVECARVLGPSGLAVHLMPTPSWRLWTSLTHYAHLLKQAAVLTTRRMSRPVAQTPPASMGTRRQLRKLMFAEPHGTASAAWQELFDFSRGQWVRRFESAGYEVLEAYPTGLFYSGYAILPGLGIPKRQALARIAGSSCNVFVSRPRHR